MIRDYKDVKTRSFMNQSATKLLPAACCLLLVEEEEEFQNIYLQTIG